jgi:acyl carrier protein
VNTTEIRAIVLETLAEVVPDLDPAGLDPDADLRDELDLDSMDTLTIVSRFEERLAITIPDRDVAGMDTLDATVTYLADRRAAAAT